MPNLIDIRRRIRSVKNTQQITKAMKMVAAAKLRRSQERITATRPYALELKKVVGKLAQASGEGDGALGDGPPSAPGGPGGDEGAPRHRHR
jgi:F-type H+-transporting ATPase subunit gamma